MLGQYGIRNEINQLVRFYFDAKEDYRLAAKRSPDPDLQKNLLRLCDRREIFHKELQEIETRLAVEMSDNGHVGADLKRDWERLRGAVSGHGLEAALQLARSSDRHAIVQSELLLECGLPEPLQTTIARQLVELRRSLQQVEQWLVAERQATV